MLHIIHIDGHLGEFNRIPQTSADKNELTKNYLLHILQIGTVEERQEVLSFIKTKFILSKRTISIQKYPQRLREVFFLWLKSRVKLG